MDMLISEPVNIETCKRALRKEHERQRIAADLYLSLSQLRTLLFPISGPVWRQ